MRLLSQPASRWMCQMLHDVPGTTVDTRSASVPVLMPYFSSFYVKVNSDPEAVFLALWRVGVHAEWRSAHSQSFSFPCSHLEFGHYVMSSSYLAVLVRCLGVLSWRSLVRLWIHVLRLQIPRCISWVGRRHARWCEKDRALVRQWRKL